MAPKQESYINAVYSPSHTPTPTNRNSCSTTELPLLASFTFLIILFAFDMFSTTKEQKKGSQTLQ